MLALNLRAQTRELVEQRPGKRTVSRASVGNIATISSVYGNNLTSYFNGIVSGGGGSPS